MQGPFSVRRLIGVLAALAALAVFAAPAMAKDRNHDGIPDRWERNHDLSLKHNQAKRDQDSDGLKNKGEFRARFDPRDADTDDDAIEDGDEGAGTIVSFDAITGELVINLFNGDTVSGQVNDDTEIECENDDEIEPDDDGIEDEFEDSADDRPIAKRDSGPGDNSGPSGGDNSGPGSGEDNSGPSDNSGPGNGDDDEACDAAALVPGAVVREAEAELTADGLVFEEIELKQAATPTS